MYKNKFSNYWEKQSPLANLVTIILGIPAFYAGTEFIEKLTDMKWLSNLYALLLFFAILYFLIYIPFKTKSKKEKIDKKISKLQNEIRELRVQITTWKSSSLWLKKNQSDLILKSISTLEKNEKYYNKLLKEEGKDVGTTINKHFSWIKECMRVGQSKIEELETYTKTDTTVPEAYCIIFQSISDNIKEKQELKEDERNLLVKFIDILSSCYC